MRPERSSLFPSKHPAVRTVERSMAATGLPWRGRSVVLGVSGGADSTFLLHAINALRQRFGYAVVIAHVDHGWRGDESRADACAVSRSALGLGIPVHHLAVSVGAQARFDGGSEAAARAIRYAFFAEVAQACDAVAVLVAHTADDQAETIVLSLLRGRSMVGLSGMADVATLPVGKTSNAVLVRPMLSITAATVRETLRTYHVEWREDASNLDLSRARNRIRQEVMPAFEAISPGFRKALARAARELNAIRTIMDGAVSQACGRWELVDSAWRVKRDDWLADPLIVRLASLREVMVRTGVRVEDIESRHLDAIDRMAATNRGGANRIVGSATVTLHGGRITVKAVADVDA